MCNGQLNNNSSWVKRGKKSFQSEIIDKKEIGNKNYITNARADGALADTSKRAVVVHG
jgi:hypothetical protein